MEKESKLDQLLVRAVLDEEGFDIGTSGLNFGRLISGEVKREGARGFFKISSQRENSRNIQNELAFYTLVSRLPQELPFYVPKVISSGVFNDNQWFVREYFEEGKELGTRLGGLREDFKDKVFRSNCRNYSYPSKYRYNTPCRNTKW